MYIYIYKSVSCECILLPIAMQKDNQIIQWCNFFLKINVSLTIWTT